MSTALLHAPDRIDTSIEHELTLPVRSQNVRRPKGVDPNEPVITIVGSAETADSYDTAFVQRGMDDRRFKENPVFLRQHDDYSPPIGIAESWGIESIKVRVRGQRGRVERPATIFKIRFDVADTPDEDDDMQRVARGYFSRYERGYLRGASIRFSVPPGGAVYGDELKPEERDYYGISENGILFRKWELFELSAVTIPANEHSLLVRSAGARAFPCTPDEFRKLRSDLDDARRELTEIRSLVSERIEVRDDHEEPVSSVDAGGDPPTSASRTEAGEDPSGLSAEELDRFAGRLRQIVAR